jgi:hypothetical protein
MTNLLKVLRKTTFERPHEDSEPARDSAEMLSQLSVHRFKFSTADTAELAQEVLALGCPGLNFFGSKAGLRIGVNNALNNPFSSRKHIGRGTQTHAAQKCIGRGEVIRVLKVMLDGVSQGMRAFADKLGIQLLAVKDSLRQKIPSTFGAFA